MEVVPTTYNHYIFEKGVGHKMRKKMQNQMPLMDPAAEHDQAEELATIDAILKQRPTIWEFVYQDLYANRLTNARNRACGKSAEKVLRALAY